MATTSRDWVQWQDPASPRSPLYHLEPIGMGTPWVESLTSYTARLAEAYHVSSRILIMDAILPYQREARKVPRDSVHLERIWKVVRGLNGMRPVSQEWVDTLESLTGIHNLLYLTMLPWRNVISHQGLLRHTKAWCPCCYEEWHQTNQIIYEPLLWVVNNVELCLRHQRVLITVCPKCQKTAYALDQRSRPGYCSHCLQWLGNLYADKEDLLIESSTQEYQQQRWRTEAIGSLLAAAPVLPLTPPREQIANMLHFYIEKYLHGNVHASAPWVKVHVQQVYCYLKQERKPSVETLLLLCSALKITLLEFLTACPLQAEGTPATKPDQLPRLSRERKSPLSQEEIEFLRQALNTVLLHGDTPLPSHWQVALHLGVGATTLQKYCPEQCRLLGSRRENWASNENQIRMRQVLDEALACDEARSLASLARLLGCQRRELYHYFPELCEAIMIRYRRQFDSAFIEQRLQAALANTGPDVSWSEFARRAGYDRVVLQRKCPDLYRMISARYSEERRKKAEQRKEKLCEGIRVQVMALHQQGIYPSAYQIEKKVGVSGILREREMQAFWQTLLKDIGYRK